MKLIAGILWIFLGLTLLAAGAFAQKDKKPLEPIYNTAKDETTFFLSPIIGVDAGWGELATVSTNPDDMSAAPDRLSPLVVYCRFKGKTFIKPERVILAFQIGSLRNFRFDKDRDLSVKVDGKETKFGKMEVTERKHDGATRGPGQPNYWETLEISIELAEYLGIVEAKKIQFEIGRTKINLSDKQVKILKTIADKHLK
jgi:hypothetical protein